MRLAVWLFYLGIEPAVRRRWPQLLVGWTRLLDGRWRDPLVGRAVLSGLLFALVVLVLGHDAADRRPVARLDTHGA